MEFLVWNGAAALMIAAGIVLALLKRSGAMRWLAAGLVLLGVAMIAWYVVGLILAGVALRR